MYYLKLFYAIFIGALMTVATRFGPSLTIFAFVYLSQFSVSFSAANPASDINRYIYYLPLASLLIGAGAYFIRVSLKNYSTKIDQKILPFVDYLVLRHIEKWNLAIVSIHGQAVCALRLIQSLFLLSILSIVIAVISLPIGIMSFAVLVFALVASLLSSKRIESPANLAQRSARLENLIEQVLMAAMVIGCVLFVPRDLWLHAAVGLFVIARFVMSYRLIGKTILQWSLARKAKPLPPWQGNRKILPPPVQPIAAPAPKLD